MSALSPSEESQLLSTIEMFEVITQSQPLDPQSWDILKEAYVRLGKTKDVLNTSKKLAQVYVQLGQLSSAILEYETILQRHPDDKDVLKALAEIETRARGKPSLQRRSITSASPIASPRLEPARRVPFSLRHFRLHGWYCRVPIPPRRQGDLFVHMGFRSHHPGRYGHGQPTRLHSPIMINLEDALERILREIQPLESEGVGLWDAAERVASDSILAPIDLPPFDNSAMDGYAVRAEDVRSASPDNPTILSVIGQVPAGSFFKGQLGVSQTIRLFTGAILPEGADAVVMQEDTAPATDPSSIQVIEPVKPFENVRFRGEDLKRYDLLISRGQVFGFAQLGILAATGIGSVRAFARPKIGLIATGSELCEPGRPLAKGQIYESNRIAIRTLLSHSSTDFKIFPLTVDSPSATRDVLSEAFDSCDAVISTGGVSVGDHDFVKEAFSNVGGKIEFWKLALKPGKPFVFGKYKNVPFFGLPGNPVSALVTFQLLVRPAINKLRGIISWNQTFSQGILVESIKNHGDRRHFVRVKMDDAGRVTRAGSQGSHILKSLSESNGLLDIAPGITLAEGARVPVIKWH